MLDEPAAASSAGGISSRVSASFTAVSKASFTAVMACDSLFESRSADWRRLSKTIAYTISNQRGELPYHIALQQEEERKRKH